MRGLAFGLALLLFGCRDEPRFQCTKEPPYAGHVRECAATCGFGECFQRERAHCFYQQGALSCAPTPEECQRLASWFPPAAVCSVRQADEL